MNTAFKNFEAQVTISIKTLILSLVTVISFTAHAAAAPYADRFVWVFGWNLDRDGDIAAVTQLLDTVSQHGGNGAVVSFGLDTLCQKPPVFFQRLDQIKQASERNKIELIPAIFSVGYGGAALAHDRNLAEGLPVEDAVFAVQLLAERLHPRRVMLNMDEIRMGGTCRACRGRNMGELLGECITKQAQILRRHIPGVEIYIWSDMLDPNHNAHGDYCLVEGDYTGSWQHVPKDLIMAVWGGEPRAKSLRFFAEQGFRTLVACYYDADDLNDIKGWLEVARPLPNVRGFMYTPWLKKYGLLPAFADLLR